VPSYADLSISSQGAAGPLTHNVVTALAQLEAKGQAFVSATAAAIANTSPPDRYGREQGLSVVYKIDPLAPATTPVLLPQPPGQRFIRGLSNMGRSTSRGLKILLTMGSTIYHHTLHWHF
jgi:hypothetical protein